MLQIFDLQKILSDISRLRPLNGLTAWLSTKKGSRTIEEALWDLVERVHVLSGKEIFILKNDKGYYADLKPRKGYVLVDSAYIPL